MSQLHHFCAGGAGWATKSRRHLQWLFFGSVIHLAVHSPLYLTSLCCGRVKWTEAVHRCRQQCGWGTGGLLCSIMREWSEVEIWLLSTRTGYRLTVRILLTSLLSCEGILLVFRTNFDVVNAHLISRSHFPPPTSPEPVSQLIVRIPRTVINIIFPPISCGWAL